MTRSAAIRSTADTISLYHLALLLLSLPFDRFYSHLLLISFTAHTLLHADRAGIKQAFSWRAFLLLPLLVASWIGAGYSAFPQLASAEVGRMAVVALLPVLLSFSKLDIRQHLHFLFAIFALGSSFTVLYLFGHALVTLRFYHLPVTALLSPAFTNQNFSSPIGMHATFLSLQWAMSFVWMVHTGLQQKQRAQQLLYATGVVVMSAGLLQLGSKAVLMMVFIAVNALLPWWELRGHRRRTYLGLAITFTIALAIFVASQPTFRSRFAESLRTDLSATTTPGDVADSRMRRWNVVMRTILQAPVLGHGSGAEIPLLERAFFKERLYNSYLHQLNSHNQYLSFWLKTGIAGLLVYVAIVAYGWRIVGQRRDLLFATFLLLVTGVSFSENILDVDKGALFFGLFFAMFLQKTHRPDTPAPTAIPPSPFYLTNAQ